MTRKSFRKKEEKSTRRKGREVCQNDSKTITSRSGKKKGNYHAHFNVSEENGG